MRVIVAGGTGFIGGSLVNMLIEKGHEVAVLSRDADKVRREFGDKVISAEWDARTAKGWLGVIEETDLAVGIVNLTGENLAEGRWTNEKKRRIISSRVNSGLAVSDACDRAAKKPVAVVQGSAVGWYGPRGDERLDEYSEQGGGFLAEVCRKWEASTKPVEKLGVRRVLARTGLVLGHGGVLDKFRTPFKLFVGGPLGSGKQWMSWIHIRDEVRAIIFLLENEAASGAFNLTAPNPVTMREFTDRLGRAMGRPSLLGVPSVVLKLAFGEMAEETILDGQRAYPSRLLEMGFEFDFPVIEKAFEDLF